jgi:serine/threonine-protein kinase
VLIMRVNTCIALLSLGACTAGGLSAEDRRHHHWRDAAVDSPISVDAPRSIDAPVAVDASAPVDAPSSTSGVGPYFATPMFFNRDVSTTPKAANSDQLIAALASEGGWGNGNVMQIDFAIDVLKANNSTPVKSWTTTSAFYSPDCDHVPMPVPAGGNLEGESGYTCTTGGDCHLIVYQQDTKDLFEMYGANISSTGVFSGGCLAVWHGAQTYGPSLRGDQCTSADAAGYPIAPLLINADEVASGHIDHAVRFILPNNRVQRGFVRPATHASSTTGISGAPYYGVHLRLRADYPVSSLPSEGARVIARAMQKYGMYHADGGNIALTAQSDRHTTAKWAGLLGSHDLSALKVTDFEVIDHGSAIPLTYDCVRN